MIKYVPGVGYVKDVPGRDDGAAFVIGGQEYQAAKDSAKERAAEHYANVGNWEQYKDGTLDELKGLLGGDDWYYARLANYANDVMGGDTLQYNYQFNPTSGRTPLGHELTNRYIALKMQGMKDSDIMGALYGTDGSLWEGFNDRNQDIVQKYQRQQNPREYLPDENPLLSGEGSGPRPDRPVQEERRGFLGAYNAKKAELEANKPKSVSIRSLFKEMKDYENE